MRFEIPIVPTAQKRARHGVRNGHACAYKCKEQERDERTIEAFLAMHAPGTPMSGPILLGVRCYLPVPKSKPNRWKEDAIMGIVRPTTKPDMDNMLKQIKDCMTRMRFWEDDKQIVEYLPGTGKWYSDRPRWVVEVMECASAGGNNLLSTVTP